MFYEGGVFILCAKATRLNDWNCVWLCCCACCRCRHRCRSVEDAAAVAWQRALKSRSSHTPLNFKWSRNAFSATQREPPTATSTWTASTSASASASAGLSLRLRRARAMTPRIPLCYSDMFIKMHGKPEVRQKENSTKSSSDGLKPLEQRSHRKGSIRSRGRLEGDKSPELRPWANLRHNWRRVHVAIGAACTFNAYEILRGISQPYKWYGNELPLALPRTLSALSTAGLHSIFWWFCAAELSWAKRQIINRIQKNKQNNIWPGESRESRVGV